MLKRLISLLSILALALGCAVPALSEVHINEKKPADWDSRELLTLTCLMVPLSDSMLLEVGGKTMFIDGGTKKYWRTDLEFINRRGLDNHVDILYSTHPHDDHIGAQSSMVEHGLTADEFISTFPREHNNEFQKRMVKALDAANIPYRQLAYGEEMDFGGAHIVFWYWPDGMDPNAKSSIARITFGDASILLTGDLTGAASHYFIENFTPEQLHADILKYPHHGLVQMVAEFLDMIDPDFSFITNRKTKTVKPNSQLEKRNIPYMHNSVGAIEMQTDGTDWYIEFHEGG